MKIISREGTKNKENQLTLEGSFSAVSTPIFATNLSFFSIFRDLQDAPAEFSRNLRICTNSPRFACALQSLQKQKSYPFSCLSFQLPARCTTANCSVCLFRFKTQYFDQNSFQNSFNLHQNDKDKVYSSM